MELITEEQADQLSNPNQPAPEESVNDFTTIEEMPKEHLLMTLIIRARQVLEELRSERPAAGRELALTATKLDEAGMWLGFSMDLGLHEDPTGPASSPDLWVPPEAGKLAVVGGQQTEPPAEADGETEAGGS